MLSIMLFLGVAPTMKAQDLVPSQQQFHDTATLLLSINQTEQLLYNNTDAAIHKLDSILKKSSQIKFKEGIARSLMGLGVAYVEKGDYAKSIELLAAAKPYCQSNEELKLLWHNNMAMPYYYLGQYDKVLSEYYTALDNLKQQTMSPNPLSEALLLNNIGNVWLELQQISNALSYLRESEAICINSIQESKRSQKEPHKLFLRLLTVNFNTHADIYRNQGHTDSAMKYFKNAIKEAENTYFTRNELQKSYLGIGKLYFETGYRDSALHYYQKSLELLPDQENPYYAAIDPNISTAQLYLEEHNLTKARYYVGEAMKHINATNASGNLVAKAHQLLAHIFGIEGDYKNAFAHQQKYVSITDSIGNIEKLKIANQFEISYRLQEKNREITVKESQLREQQLLTKAIAVGTLLVIIIAIVLYRTNRQMRYLQRIKIQNIEQTHKISQLEAVMDGEEKERSRIARELHDGLGGLLAAIKMRFSRFQRSFGYGKQLENIENEISMVNTMLDEASSEIRNISHNLMPESLQHGLKEALGLYIDKINSGNDIFFNLKIKGNIDCISSPVALSLYRIIQEIVQNILKHSYASNAMIEIDFVSEIFLISAIDNGIGFDRNITPGGLGLRNIEHRVKVLDGQLKIESTPNMGTTISIVFNSIK